MNEPIGKKQFSEKEIGPNITLSSEESLSTSKEKQPRAFSTESKETTDKNEEDVEAQSTQEYVEPETPPAVRVPRSRRRGLFGRFTILAEVEEPKHYPRRAKWFITFVVALAAIAAPLGSAIFFRKIPTRLPPYSIVINH